MRVLESIRELSRSVGTYIAGQIEAQRRLSRFSCGDCDLHDQCGLPPSDDCVERLEQIERYGDRRRTRTSLQAATWI